MWSRIGYVGLLSLAFHLSCIESAVNAEWWNPFHDSATSVDPNAPPPQLPSEAGPLNWRAWPLPPPSLPQPPIVLQKFQASTRQAMTSTRQLLTAPFQSLGTTKARLLPWTGSAASTKSSQAGTAKSYLPGWFPPETPEAPAKPQSVNDFLSRPRPE